MLLSLWFPKRDWFPVPKRDWFPEGVVAVEGGEGVAADQVEAVVLAAVGAEAEKVEKKALTKKRVDVAAVAAQVGLGIAMTLVVFLNHLRSPQMLVFFFFFC